MLKDYVVKKEETDIVSEARRGYIKTYAPFILEKCNITSESVVVDVPCGTGDMAQKIDQEAHPQKLILIDINQEMINTAKQKLSDRHSFIVGAAGDIQNLISSSVGAVYCLNGLHQYIQKKEAFVRGSHHILKNGGRFVFDISTRGLTDTYTQTFFNLQEKYLQECAEKDNVVVTLPEWPNKDTLSKYKGMIKDAGLTLIDTHTFTDKKDVETVYESATKIPGRSRPWLKGMDYERRKAAFRYAVNRVVEELGEGNIETNRIFFIVEK